MNNKIEKIAEDKTEKISQEKIEKIAEEVIALELKDILNLIKVISSKCDIDLSSILSENTVSQQSDESFVEEKKIKTYTVKLISFDQQDTSKLTQIIKTVRLVLNNPHLSVVDIKNKVTSLPLILKENIKKEETESLKNMFSEISCKLEINES